MIKLLKDVLPQTDPNLYPEKSRADLEFMYHGATAALLFAAQEKVGDNATAIHAQINAWLELSTENAVKSALVRQVRNYSVTGKVH